MNYSEIELVELEAAHRANEEQQVFRQARFDDLTAQIVARKADGTLDGWKHYLHGELKRLEFSDSEILAGIELAKSTNWAVEPVKGK